MLTAAVDQSALAAIMFVETSLAFENIITDYCLRDSSRSAVRLAQQARQIEQLGFRTLHIEADRADPFHPLNIGAAATNQLQLAVSTSVLPHSPTTTARSMWALQGRSEGRVLLGLGPQPGSLVAGRRCGRWTPLPPQMRDYIMAIRAAWSGWQRQQPVRFESDHYRIDMSLPALDPKPINSPDIPIQIAGFGQSLCEVAGEVANGIRLSPLCTPQHVTRVVQPALAAGASRSGRDAQDIEVCIRPLIVTAPDHKSLMQMTEHTRARLAFYLSVPAYRMIFELHGWGSQAQKARRLASNNHWAKLPDLVSDDMLHTFATVATYQNIAQRLLDRFEGIADRIEYSTSQLAGPELEALPSIIQALSRRSPEPSRHPTSSAEPREQPVG